MDVLLAIVKLLVVIAFMATPFVIPFVIQRWTTGWKSLERHYGVTEGYPPLADQSFRCVSARFGRVESSLSVEVTKSGLWLGTPFPGSLFMQRLLIPWEDMTIEELPSALLVRRAEIRIKGYPRPVRFFGDPSSSLIAIHASRTAEPNKLLHATREDALA